MYFLSVWGSEYLNTASENEKQAKDLVNILENTFNSVEKTASNLNKDIVDFTEYIENVNGSSDSLTKAMHEIGKGVEIETNSISTVSQIMDGAQTKMEYTDEIRKCHMKAIR